MEYVYESVVLTSIDVIDSPTPECPNRVVFSSDIPGKKDDSTATFIHKVRDIPSINDDKNDQNGGNSGLLEAEKLLPSQVQEIINAQSSDENEKSTSNTNKNRKVLFSVHGFNANHRGYLLQIKYAEERFQKFKLIPVLWPSAGSMLGYFTDRSFSKGAGKAFQSIVEPIETFEKSLLCHSMGNLVLRKFANSSYNFDNIFMVAPDIESTIFLQSYIEGGDQEWRKDGLKITKMLNDKKEGGKVHVLYNKNDSDLLLSTIVNMKSRLGRAGIALDGCFTSEQTLHDEVKDKIEMVDWTNNSPSNSHNYQFDWSVVAYYESQYI